MTDFIFGTTPGDLVYDIESYPNYFAMLVQHVDTKDQWYFEVSDRQNDVSKLVDFLDTISSSCRLVGYNNIGYDYPVIHFLYKNAHGITAREIYGKSMSIIDGFENRFAHLVWDSEWIVPQVDLFKIHHFDNKARSTKLKVLENNMRMESIEETPIAFGTVLNYQEMDEVKKYLYHDVEATLQFYNKSLKQIKFREELSERYNKNFLNHNDTKIGKDYFIMRLEEASPGTCYQYINGKKRMVQTNREKIIVNDIIFPYIEFEDVEFKRILNWFKEQVITETKGAFSNINCTVKGFQFDFGTGGIHGSLSNTVVESDDYYMISDLDVASFYPNIAIVNRLYPEHLGELFCDIYKDVFEQRKTYDKKSAENAMLKLALNGVYGDSNNEYSPFYDPQYTMSITINGQLLLCMLAEALMIHEEVQLIQINTDGLTIKHPRHLLDWIKAISTWWEGFTNLTLESAEYKRFFVRDVNNYIAEYTDGKIKRKGAYEYEMQWHQDHSALVVPKAVEAHLIHGTDIAEYIYKHTDIFDFFLCVKTARDSHFEWNGKKVESVLRYYISTEGKPLEKVMPAKGVPGTYKRANKLTDEYYNLVLNEVGNNWDPRIHTKNKSKYEENRRSGIHPGFNVQVCNNLSGLSYTDLNREWYINEARKLVRMVK